MRRIDGIRARLRLLFAHRSAESRMDEEIRFHVEMEAERLVREEGLDPRDARRRALVAFGGVEKTREQLRVPTPSSPPHSASSPSSSCSLR